MPVRLDTVLTMSGQALEYRASNHGQFQSSRLEPKIRFVFFQAQCRAMNLHCSRTLSLRPCDKICPTDCPPESQAYSALLLLCSAELGLEVDADGTGALQSFAAPAGGWMGIVGGGSAEQEGRSVETQALRQEIAELRGTIEHLEQALQTTTCLSITAAREGLCLSSSKPVAGAIIPGKGVSATSTSTSASAVLRPAGYRSVV